ncbi:MAG TPA: hypothetical protein ENK55_06985 [Actinobacteria bacterium]|nr:hypothetical protein [Actinomycetota bacterium]
MPDLATARRLLELVESLRPEDLPAGFDATVTSLREAVTRAETRPLVVVLVGPSGTGKTSLFNAAVGRRVGREGVLRPTTGAPLLAGAELEDVDLEPVDADLGGIALVDLPPIEHDPATVRRFVAVADLCLVVTSAARYADEATAAAVELAERYGVPATIVVNRVPADVPSARLRRALVQRHGRRDVVTIGEGEAADRITGILQVAAADVARIRRYRGDAAIEAAAAEVAELVDHLADRVAAAGAAREGLARELERRRLPDALRPIVAASPWEEAVRQIAAGVEHEATGALVGLGVEPDPVDAESALVAWREAVEEAAIEAIDSVLRRRVVAGVLRRHLWRAAIDRGYPTPLLVRWAFGTRLRPVLEASAAAFDDAVAALVADAVDPALEEFERRMRLPVAELRSVALELTSSAYRTELFRLTPDVEALRAAAEAGLPFGESSPLEAT